MEIERKFTIRQLPENLNTYKCKKLCQAYLNRNPVVRIRKEDDEYFLTYKGKGLLSREEYNLPLSKEAFEHMLTKADGKIISKTRYLIPIENPRFTPGFVQGKPPVLTVELDVFDDPFSPLIMAEVEFPDEETAQAYIPESWFNEDVTFDRAYHNVNMAYSNED